MYQFKLLKMNTNIKYLIFIWIQQTCTFFIVCHCMSLSVYMFYKIFSSVSFSIWVASWNNNLITKWCGEGGPVVMCRPLYYQVSNGPLKTLPSWGYSLKRFPVYPVCKTTRKDQVLLKWPRVLEFSSELAHYSLGI